MSSLDVNLLSTTAQSRLARSLALVALLLVTGLTSAEVSHQHTSDDSRLECLLCHSGIDNFAAPQTAAADTPALPGTVYIALTATTRHTHAITPPARGPPAHS